MQNAPTAEATTRPVPPLTHRQRDILAWLFERARAGEPPPGLRDIGRHFGIHSPNGVLTHVKALERKGYVRRRKDLSRHIVILRDPDGRRVASWRPVYDDEASE
jgi:repressor LexA